MINSSISFYHRHNSLVNIALGAGAIGFAYFTVAKVRQRLSTRAWNRRAVAFVDIRDRKLDIAMVLSGVSAEKVRLISSLSTSALVDMLSKGELTSEEVTRVFIFLAKSLHKKFNFLADVCFEEALEQARALDELYTARGGPIGPLHGLPMSIKDCLAVDGTVATAGSAKLVDVRCSDAVLVKVLKRAGAVIFAKTNVPQTMFIFDCSNPVFGATLNPWNTERTPGGSSGGEAAMIAAGASPLGIGTDIGGSVRIPAHFCGICSLKPTACRLNSYGQGAAKPVNGQETIRSTAGPMARNVDELILACSVMMSPYQFSLDCEGMPPVVFDETKLRPGRPLRVAYYTYDGFFQASDGCKRAVTEAVEALRGLGAEVFEIDSKEWSPPGVREAMRLYYTILGADGGKSISQFLRGEEVDKCIARLIAMVNTPTWLLSGGLAAAGAVLGWTRMASTLGSYGELSVKELYDIVHERQKYKRSFIGAWKEEGFDVLLAPAFAAPANPHGGPQDATGQISYTALWNLLDFPAGILPVSVVSEREEAEQRPRLERDAWDKAVDSFEIGSSGLPVGVQVIGLPWQDEQVLYVMQMLERALGNFAPGEELRAKLCHDALSEARMLSSQDD